MRNKQFRITNQIFPERRKRKPVNRKNRLICRKIFRYQIIHNIHDFNMSIFTGKSIPRFIDRKRIRIEKNRTRSSSKIKKSSIFEHFQKSKLNQKKNDDFEKFNNTSKTKQRFVDFNSSRKNQSLSKNFKATDDFVSTRSLNKKNHFRR